MKMKKFHLMQRTNTFYVILVAFFANISFFMCFVCLAQEIMCHTSKYLNMKNYNGTSLSFKILIKWRLMSICSGKKSGASEITHFIKWNNIHGLRVNGSHKKQAVNTSVTNLTKVWSYVHLGGGGGGGLHWIEMHSAMFTILKDEKMLQRSKWWKNRDHKVYISVVCHPRVLCQALIDFDILAIYRSFPGVWKNCFDFLLSSNYRY